MRCEETVASFSAMNILPTMNDNYTMRQQQKKLQMIETQHSKYNLNNYNDLVTRINCRNQSYVDANMVGWQVLVSAGSPG